MPLEENSPRTGEIVRGNTGKGRVKPNCYSKAGLYCVTHRRKFEARGDCDGTTGAEHLIIRLCPRHGYEKVIIIDGV